MNALFGKERNFIVTNFAVDIIYNLTNFAVDIIYNF